jgi:hypothetical protein
MFDFTAFAQDVRVILLELSERSAMHWGRQRSSDKNRAFFVPKCDLGAIPDRACAICTIRASSGEVLRKPLTPRERQKL